MKKIVLCFAFVVAAIVGVTTNTFKTHMSKEDHMIQMNLEALTAGESEEDVRVYNCTKINETGNCYKNNMFFCTYIKSVTEYTVTEGSPILCHHAYVTTCPDGTSYTK